MSSQTAFNITEIRITRYGSMGNMLHKIYSAKFLWSKLDFIHLNPLRSGIIARVSDYLYSSSANFMHQSSVVKDVTLADNPVADMPEI